MTTTTTWTTEKLTVPGWYWFKGRVECAAESKPLKTQPYEIKFNAFWGNSGLALYETDHLIFGLDDLDGQYYGPLEVPV